MANQKEKSSGMSNFWFYTILGIMMFSVLSCDSNTRKSNKRHPHRTGVVTPPPSRPTTPIGLQPAPPATAQYKQDIAKLISKSYYLGSSILKYNMPNCLCDLTESKLPNLYREQFWGQVSPSEKDRLTKEYKEYNDKRVAAGYADEKGLMSVPFYGEGASLSDFFSQYNEVKYLLIIDWIFVDPNGPFNKTMTAINQDSNIVLNKDLTRQLEDSIESQKTLINQMIAALCAQHGINSEALPADISQLIDVDAIGDLDFPGLLKIKRGFLIIDDDNLMTTYLVPFDLSRMPIPKNKGHKTTAEQTGGNGGGNDAPLSNEANFDQARSNLDAFRTSVVASKTA